MFIVRATSSPTVRGPAMARHTRLSLVLTALAVFFCTEVEALLPASAQVVAAPSGGGESVTLGHSFVALYGPWKFTVGDSPIDAKTGQPLWSEPDFDDSRWETVELKPKIGAVDPLSGETGYVPG